MNTKKSLLRTALAAAIIAVAPGFAIAQSGNTANPPDTTRTVGEYIDDATLTARVKTALIGADGVKARDVSVEVRDGVVMLSGFVDSQAEIDAAERITRGVSGVRSVTNSLKEKPAR